MRDDRNEGILVRPRLLHFLHARQLVVVDRVPVKDLVVEYYLDHKWDERLASYKLELVNPQVLQAGLWVSLLEAASRLEDIYQLDGGLLLPKNLEN